MSAEIRDARHEHLPPESRQALGRMILEAREAHGWSRERLSVEAEECLRKAARDFVTPIYVTSEERVLWREIDITSNHIQALEAGPVLPLGRGPRRARLRGVCLALGLDFAEINRIAGGL